MTIKTTLAAKTALAAGVFCAVFAGSLDLSGPRPLVGFEAAQAKDFYTRKRVNGRWVTGVFPKKGSKLEAETRAKEQVAAAPTEAPKPQPTLLGLNIPGVDLTYRPPMSAQTQAAAAAPAETGSVAAPASTPASSRLIAGTPGVQDDGDENPRAGKRVRSAERKAEPRRERVASAKPRVQSAAERRRADEAFARATRQANAAEPEPLPAAVQAYAPAPDQLLTALQRKARAMADDEAHQTGAIVRAEPVRAEPARPAATPVRAAARAVKSMTLDYEAGIRTTIYQDGSIEEQPIEGAAP